MLSTISYWQRPCFSHHFKKNFPNSKFECWPMVHKAYMKKKNLPFELKRGWGDRGEISIICFSNGAYIQDGVMSGSSGLQGCIKDMKLDGKRIGFPDVLETFEVRTACVWDFPCLLSPCVGSEVCQQDGLTGHSCTCSNPPCATSSHTGKVLN